MKLKPGEVKCDECNGIGYFSYITEIQEYNNDGMIHQIPGYKRYYVCNKCHGTKKLDWIENVVGKKQDYDIWFRPHGIRRGTINAIKLR